MVQQSVPVKACSLPDKYCARKMVPSIIRRMDLVQDASVSSNQAAEGAWRHADDLTDNLEKIVGVCKSGARCDFDKTGTFILCHTDAHLLNPNLVDIAGEGQTCFLMEYRAEIVGGYIYLPGNL